MRAVLSVRRVAVANAVEARRGRACAAVVSYSLPRAVVTVGGMADLVAAGVLCLGGMATAGAISKAHQSMAKEQWKV